MPSNLDNWSPKRLARVAALLSIGSGIPDGYSVSVLKKVFVRDDAAATAANIFHAEQLFRSGIVAELFGLVIFAASIVLLYVVFRPASRRGALLFLVIGMMGATIQSLDVLGDIAALTLLNGGPAAAGLPTPEAQSMAFLFVKMHSFIYTVSLGFTGFGALWLAYAAARATFIPRISGYFLMIDGLGYITYSFGTLWAPAFIIHLQPVVPFFTAILGTGALLLWLIAKGVDEERWQEMARAAG